MRDLREAGMVDALFQISGIGPTLFGRNGGGDPYYTNGEIDVASLVVDGSSERSPGDAAVSAANCPEGSNLA